MYGLILSADDVFTYGPEPCVEVCYRVFVRVVIVHSETSSEVDVVDFESVSFEICNDVVDSPALKCIDFVHSGDLRTDMEVKADEIDVLALAEDVDEFVELVLRDAELVLIKTCGHVLMSVRIDVRIDSY